MLQAAPESPQSRVGSFQPSLQLQQRVLLADHTDPFLWKDCQGMFLRCILMMHFHSNSLLQQEANPRAIQEFYLCTICMLKKKKKNFSSSSTGRIKNLNIWSLDHSLPTQHTIVGKPLSFFFYCVQNCVDFAPVFCRGTKNKCGFPHTHKKKQ